MDIEFLMDYEAKEKDEIKRFGQKFGEGILSTGINCDFVYIEP